MRNFLAVAVGVAAFAATGHALAVCSSTDGSTRIGNQPQINSALGGKRINAVSPGGEDWKEDHCAAGALYKVGDGSAVDPRVRRGTWSIVGTGNDRSVQYAYTGGSTYTWTLWQNNGTLYFCNGTTEIARTVSIGTAGTPCN